MNASINLSTGIHSASQWTYHTDILLEKDTNRITVIIKTKEI